MSINKHQIEGYLKDFKQKKKIWGILFRDDRGKNAQTLLDLELQPARRDQIIEKIEVDDYIEGPVPDTLNHGADMWVRNTSKTSRCVHQDHYGRSREQRNLYLFSHR